VTVRPGRSEDLAAVRALDVEAFGIDAWSEPAWRDEWDQVPDLRHLVVAVEAGEIVGFGLLAAVAGVADLHRIAVTAPWRRRGVGRALVEALLAEARARRCDRMLLEVEAANEAALALYDRLGFVRIARRRAYYGPDRDAVVLERRLA
jgi:[ribosomal protein S18]-alanine N-acetyltransferase